MSKGSGARRQVNELLDDMVHALRNVSPEDLDDGMFQITVWYSYNDGGWKHSIERK